MPILLHQTKHLIGDFASRKNELFEIAKMAEDQSSLHLFPELYLTGYPLQDLCLMPDFIKGLQELLGELDRWNQKRKDKHSFLLGGLDYSFDSHGRPREIGNSIFFLEPGREIQKVYQKQLLPNYDIFDERKYFTPGGGPSIIQWEGKSIGLLICEDMWSSDQYNHDPVAELKEYSESKKRPLDLVVNLSASPYHLGKPKKRHDRSSEIARYLDAPYFYINQVGLEDEILFDGRSFVCDAAGKVCHQAQSFRPQVLEVDLPKASSNKKEELSYSGMNDNWWSALFDPRLDSNSTPARLVPLSDLDCDEILEALSFSLNDYAHKCGFEKFVVALSGGIDSALALAITKYAADKREVIAIAMPGQFSSSLSSDLAREMCQILGVKLFYCPIKFLHSTCRNTFLQSFNEELKGVADENIQSRLRGSMLYAYANAHGHMAINTSNRSELAVGYSTLYGDSVGALSILGDLYKEDVFQLSRYLNKRFQKEIIPQGIIDRPPSAELRENQEDAHSLPPYERLDAILEGHLSYRYTLKDLEDMGHSREEIHQAATLFQRSEFKRRQFCPIVKIQAKSFGFGHRLPICKDSQIR